MRKAGIDVYHGLHGNLRLWSVKQNASKRLDRLKACTFEAARECREAPKSQCEYI